MELFKLFGSILITDKDAINALNNTSKKVDSTGDKIKKFGVGAAKVGAAVVTVGAAAAAGLSKMATSTAEAGDRVDKLSQKIGLSRTGFQEWDYIMSQNGMEIEKLQNGMKTLVNSFDDAKKGTASYVEAFDRIGLSIDDLKGKSQEELFEATLAGLQGVTDQTERAALANELLGRSGSEMAPLIAQSAESIEALRQNAHDLGKVLSDETVDGAVLLGDTIDDLKIAGAGLMNQLGSALIPILQEVVEVILDNLPMIQSMFAKLAPILADVFSKLLPPLLTLVEALLPPVLELIELIMPILGELMDAIMPVILDLLNMLLPPIMQIVKMLLPLLMDILRPLFPLLKPILALLQPVIDLLMMIIEPLVELLNMILPPLVALLSLLIAKIIPPLTKVLEFLGEMIGTNLKNAFNGIKPIIENIKNIFNGLISFVKNIFSGNWKGAWENVKTIFSNIWDGIKNVFKLPVNWIIDGINGFLKGINKIKIPDWVPLVGGKGFNIPEIPRLKVGMDYVPYDEFPAILHKGERVMTADENKSYSSGMNTRIEIPLIVNGREISRAIVDDIDEFLGKASAHKLRTQGGIA